MRGIGVQPYPAVGTGVVAGDRIPERRQRPADRLHRKAEPEGGETAIDAHSRRHRGVCVGIFHDRWRGGADRGGGEVGDRENRGQGALPVNSTRASDFVSPPSARQIVVRNSVAAWGIEVLRWSERRARRNKG
jgi:hypothetical protein